MTKHHRFTMYQNIIYDEGQIINPFECMKLLNYFFDENADLKEENNQLKRELAYCKDRRIDENVKWLRENTVWEQMPTSIRTISKSTLKE